MPNTYTPVLVAQANLTEPVDGEARTVASMTTITRAIANGSVALRARQGGTVVSAMTNANYVAPIGEYSFSLVEVPAALTLTADRTYTVPTPATEAASYFFALKNATTGGFNIRVVTGADATGVLLTNVQTGWLHVRPATVKYIVVI